MPNDSRPSDKSLRVSDLIDANDEIIVTKEMTDAGLQALLNHRFSEPPFIILEDVFRTMVYARSAQPSKTF